MDDRTLILIVSGVILLGTLAAFLVQFFRRDRD